jgi:glycosyltransferase involved in cell wall biosynthesis
MIKRFYRRDSVVIYPPVDIGRFAPSPHERPLRHGFVIAGRQTPYKRIDLAISACNELKVPLVVIGNGPDHHHLVRMAGRNTTFLTNVDDEDMVIHFQSALGFIMPNMDDFGIVAVEAIAAGTPVIAYQKGGALDYVVPGKTGLFFEQQSVQSLAAALETVLSKSFNYEQISEYAAQFSVTVFHKNMRAYIKQTLLEAKE